MADWVLGVARLISSARQICVKIGPRWNSNSRSPVGRFHDHVRAQDVGRHQVGRELDPGELQVERLGQRADQERLAQPRHAFQQAMPADEQAGQHAVDDLVVADDHPADLFADGLVAGQELLGPAFHGFSNAHAMNPSSFVVQEIDSRLAGPNKFAHSFLSSHTFFFAFSNRSV